MEFDTKQSVNSTPPRALTNSSVYVSISIRFPFNLVNLVLNFLGLMKISVYCDDLTYLILLARRTISVIITLDLY